MSGFGVVLAGGAARGAYEAGVMRYLFLELPKQLGYQPWPMAISGTSVGAINGVHVAARNTEGIARLSRRWQTMHIEDVYRLEGWRLVQVLRNAFSAEKSFALLDASPLYALIQEEFPTKMLRGSIDGGHCRAFIIAATELGTGTNSLFLDGAPDVQLNPRPGSQVRRTRIGPIHCMASSALPFLFPAVRVGGHYHVDGGLRQNTPLRPVIRAGARRVLLVGLSQPRDHDWSMPPDKVMATLPFLAGKSLNAVMLDPVDRDLKSASQINDIIAWGTDRYGPQFADAFSEDLDLHHVQTVFLRPSEDVGRMAADIWRQSPLEATGPVRWLLSLLADRHNTGEADLLSYLFFDRAYTGALEQLGFEDARRSEAALVQLVTA